MNSLTYKNFQRKSFIKQNSWSFTITFFGGFQNVS